MADTGEPTGLDALLGSDSVSTVAPSPQAVDNNQLNAKSTDVSADPNEPPGVSELIAPELKEQQYGSPLEQGKAALEGLGQGFAGPVFTAAERALGVNPEAVRAREEVNPLTHYGTEALGLGIGAFTGTGEAGLAAKAGEVGAHALGLGEAASTAAKIGSAAVKGAIENSLIQGGDEVSKLILQDPNQSAQTALYSIGLGGLIGGASGGVLGAISPLWEQAGGKKTHGLLDAISKRLGGIEGDATSDLDNVIQSSGMNISPEIKAGMSQDPAVQHMFQTLQESSTGSGLKAQASLNQFRSDASDAIVNSLGKTPSDIESLGSLSEADIGNEIKKSLTGDLQDIIEPISNQFENIKAKYSSVELTPITKNQIADEISTLAHSEGYAKAPSSAQAHLIQTTLKELPLQTTLEDLRKYQGILSDKTYGNPELARVGGQLKGILRSAEDNAIHTAAGAEAPELLQEHGMARDAYAAAMRSIDALDDRLHVGRYVGPSSFRKALSEMSPEDILRRLSPKSDSQVIPLLGEVSPKTLELLRDYHLSSVLKGAAARAGNDQILNPKLLFNNLSKLSPEMRDFVVPAQAQARIKGIQSLMESIPSKMNTSGTAKTLDALWKNIPGSALGLATMIAGHNPAVAFVMGKLGQYLGRDVPDAIKLSMLKFLGSSRSIDAPGFKAMTDYVETIAKGEKVLNKAAKNVFTAGEEILPQAAMPTDRDRSRIDAKLQDLQADPSSLTQVGGKISAYMPEHAQALSQTASNVVQYVNAQRPANAPKSPLDSPIPVSNAQKANFNRVLDLAQAPLIILNKVKSGTVTPQEVASFKAMYPDLYARTSQKLISEMTNTLAKGKHVPYATRMGLSLFTAQPLDSTMTPQGIMAAQPMPPAGPQGSNIPGVSKSKHSTAPLTKLSGLYMTPGQARSNSRQKIE